VRWSDPEIRRRWLLAGLAALAAAGLLIWIRRPDDFDGYLLVGDLVLHGRHIYADAPAGINTWPPFFSLLCVPLALVGDVSRPLARAIWIVLNYGLLLVVLDLLARLLYRRPLGLHGSAARLSLTGPELLLPLVLTYRYVVSNFEHLQVNLLILTLALGGMYLQANRRPRAGGLAIGCAAALKVMPAILIPYLAWRRRWRAAAYAAAGTALFSLSPALVFGWSRLLDYLASWRAALERGWSVGKMNEAVLAMWDRYLGHGFPPLATPGVNDVPPSGHPAVTIAWAASLALAAAALAWSFRRSRGEDRRTDLTEWSAVFLVGALFGPVCWKAYLVVLLLANTLLVAVWRDRECAPRTRRVAAATLLVSFALGGLTTEDLLGRALANRIEMASAITVAALVVLAGLVVVRTRLGAAPRAPRPAGPPAG
jgi:Glycosyltransferase family 87